MLKNFTFLIISCCLHNITAQQADSLSIKNGIDNPSILSSHHFGIFSSRINQNFKIAPPKTSTLYINSVSGNNFHPFVESYFPKDPEVRKELNKEMYYNRSFEFINQESTPAEYMNIVIDAVIKEFRLGVNIPLSEKNELGITLRSYLITKGTNPFSFFSSDETIEWFHSNIAGGEDPYGRRFLGLNQVNFKYTDRNNNTLELSNNDFFIGGIEFNHYYYPSLAINKTKNIYLNFGSHLGINTSQFNSSLDIGVSANAIKSIELKNSNEIYFGFGVNFLRKNVIDFDTTIDLGNNAFLATLEGNIEYTKYTKKNNYHALGVNYQIQSRYNKREEEGYFKLTGNWQDINGGWHHGVSTLYKALSNWTFIYTYGRPSFKLALYFKEDFTINNAPDFQTGLSVQLPILK